MEHFSAFQSEVSHNLEQLYLELWKECTPSEPRRLFHYTCSEALVGIAATRKFFLSDMLASTDQSEVRHGIGVIRTVLEKEEPDRITKAVLQSLKNNELWTIGESVFVHAICFCTGDDVLTQWRGYSSGGGVAIGVDFNKLKAQAENLRFALAKMLYIRDKQEEMVRRILSRSREFLPRLKDALHGTREEQNKQGASFLSEIAICFLKAALFFKHEAFSSEDEWRVLKLETPEDLRDKLKFRARGNTVTPYVELPIEPLLITEIRCSPGFWSQSAIYGMERLAMRFGPHVRVTHSALPL